ncbi:epoxide hydrolase [Sphingomonas limnosediminicola]|uniref:epoxide hydrolase family protein n=1 Tax=Sphingomonas limnosediminicola TaxID=940133 RepID=UPI0031DE24CB
MPGPCPSVVRRHLLSSAFVGALMLMLPATAADAAPGSPGGPSGETLSPAPAPSDASSAAGSRAIIGAAASFAPADDPSIRPFKYHASDAELADLKRRVRATRWPTRELVPDDTQGVQLATMQKLAAYWADQYDWRKVEARLNALPMFVTNIDGVDIHFIHVKSKLPNALPIIITHGWPGSIIEELKIIDPLTNPTAHGGKAEDAFDVVIPSLPGYGFSGKPTELGWEPVRIARAWAALMDRLGYKKFVASGGDWGDPVTEQLAVNHSDHVLGVHLNMPSAVPPEIFAAIQGGPTPANLSPDENYALDQLKFFFSKGLGYAQEMTLRPQTLYALEDSPIGLAAWILDHDKESYELIARVFDGTQEGLTRDDILDNITLYWLTGTAVSSARLYWENKLAFFKPQGIRIPVVISANPTELYQVPESWAKAAFPKLIYYKRHPKGGHFASWEQPQFWTEDVREGFRSLR